MDSASTARDPQAELERYKVLFNSIDQGFCIITVLFDDLNNPTDYRFLEMNTRFEEQTGLKNALGHTARELVPTLEDHWFQTYGRVALTGIPERFVNSSAPMNRWFDVYAFRVGGPEERQVAILFRDITEQKKTEDALRLRESQLRLITDTTPVMLTGVHVACNMSLSTAPIPKCSRAILRNWKANTCRMFSVGMRLLSSPPTSSVS